MPEYPFRWLAALAAAFALTPVAATTYAPAFTPPVSSTSEAPDAAQNQTWGASYDTLTGKFATTPATSTAETIARSDCGASNCSADTPAPAPQPVARQADAPAAAPQAARTAAAEARAASRAPNPSAVSAASNWDAATLVADVYGYNGNNNDLRVDSVSSYLPPLPDLNSWAMMLGGMIAIGFLMRRATPPSLVEPDAVDQAWGGPTAKALELRTLRAVMPTSVVGPTPKLCVSRQALPGS